MQINFWSPRSFLTCLYQRLMLSIETVVSEDVCFDCSTIQQPSPSDVSQYERASITGLLAQHMKARRWPSFDSLISTSALTCLVEPCTTSVVPMYARNEVHGLERRYSAASFSFLLALEPVVGDEDGDVVRLLPPGFASLSSSLWTVVAATAAAGGGWSSIGSISSSKAKTKVSELKENRNFSMSECVHHTWHLHPLCFFIVHIKPYRQLQLGT